MRHKEGQSMSVTRASAAQDQPRKNVVNKTMTSEIMLQTSTLFTKNLRHFTHEKGTFSFFQQKLVNV